MGSLAARTRGFITLNDEGDKNQLFAVMASLA
jgi:hypothetical protein